MTQQGSLPYLLTSCKQQAENLGRSRGFSTGDVRDAPPVKRPRIKSVASSSSKMKKVYCYVTPKQIIIREYFLKIFYKRIFTFRLSPNTKLRCGEADPVHNQPMLVIDDGLQNTAGLLCPRRSVLVATVVGVIQGNMGSSETFDEKVKNFNRLLLQHHRISVTHREKIQLDVDRKDLLNASYKATKDLHLSSWFKVFVISFKNENGLDWGGLNREWIHLLCKAMFEAREEGGGDGDGTAEQACGLFRKFKDDPQALVLPNSSSVSNQKLKMYEFAGKLVGKCLVESAVGAEHRRQVAARFARSFLAQIIGLPVTYKHFESDDPDLYMTKVKYIIENDVTDGGMTFSEEEYSGDGRLLREVDLIPKGSEIDVTNENKMRYLNRIAQHRLRESIKPEIDSFIKGLNWLVPDELLGIFDENEIELLLCGASHINVEDLKRNCLLSGFGPSDKVLGWFWNVISNFTQAELARLLQFTTGCSHLPPDGFKSLQPNFKISHSPYNEGSLPTAHTCFNELCLPSYTSYEDLHKMLKIALTEGATGFGLV